MPKKYATKHQRKKAQREQAKEWAKKNIKTFTFNFHLDYDSDIIDYLNNQSSKIEFMRFAIRNAMNKETD